MCLGGACIPATVPPCVPLGPRARGVGLGKQGHRVNIVVLAIDPEGVLGVVVLRRRAG